MRDATKLNVYFNGDKTLFLIPLYQRKYAWQRKHCERLFMDLEKVHKNNLRSHFFGSIVSIKASETEDDLLIIDGQQRITTISLLILAAINSVKEGIMSCEDDEFVEDMRNKYLRAKYRRVERKNKLRPIDQDLKAYDALFNGDSDKYVPADQSSITQNYFLFCQLIKSSGLSFEELISAIEKLIIIDIRLDSGDNPQLIFESLNSCGKDLEESDKVRNYLLMSLTSEKQEEYYRHYWSKIEEYTGDELTMFIRDYLTVKRKVISSINELYFDFKDYDEAVGMKREDLLAEMLKFACYYKQAAKGDGKSERISRKFKQLANVGSSVCMPFFLSFLEYAEINSLSEDEIYDVLDVVENYWARRIICAYPANVMSKTFALIHSDIIRFVRTHEKRNVPLTVPYVELLKYVLLKKQGNAVFPNDVEVKESFPTRQIYRLPIDYRYFLFERMENGNSKEADDTIVARMKKNTITIEHIMPQTLTTEWKTELGADWQNVYEKYLHTFSNLTLTGYNSNYGNHSFIEKKEGYIDKKGNQIYGFKDSAFTLSNYLRTCEKWTEFEMKEREKLLENKFLALWPMITSSYVPLNKETETVSFDDDEYELTNRLIAAFTYKGVRHSVLNWKDMLVQVCKLVCEENPTAFVYLATKNYWVHDSENKERSKIANNCYVHSSCSTKTKCSILKYVFEHMNVPMSDLEFDLIPLSEKTVDEDDE